MVSKTVVNTILIFFFFTSDLKVVSKPVVNILTFCCFFFTSDLKVVSKTVVNTIVIFFLITSDLKW